MTSVRFFGDKSRLSGFLITGHSTQDCDDFEGKLLCAAVSSAAYMTTNTLTEIVGATCEIELEDGYMSLKLCEFTDGTQTVLAGFKLHIEQLCEQYSNIELNLEV